MFPYQSKVITNALIKMNSDINELHKSFEEIIHNVSVSSSVNLGHTREWSLVRDSLKKMARLLTTALKCQKQSLMEDKLWFGTIPLF